MSEDTNNASTLQDLQVPVQAKLAAAWTSFMFLYIYVDYFALWPPTSSSLVRITLLG
jgi:hypothetical protein